jgi:aspartate racemase
MTRSIGEDLDSEDRVYIVDSNLSSSDRLYELLCAGQLLAPSRERLRKIILDLQRAKAEAVVLACTELPLLIRPEDSAVKLFDTLAIHVKKAVTLALEA